MKRLFRFSLAFAVLIQSNWSPSLAYDRSAARAKDAIELPELVTKSVSTGSATDLITALAFSFPFPGVAGEKETEKLMQTGGLKLYPGKELVGFEAQIGMDFIQGKGSFRHLTSKPSQRILILHRYGYDNPKAIELMKMAKEKNIFAGILITDSNNSLDESKIDFKGEKSSNELTPDKLSSGKQGLALRELLESGYRMVSPKHQSKSSSQALIEKGDFYFTMNSAGNGEDKDRDPLMHEKAMVMVELIDENKGLTNDNIKSIHVTDGTNNWTSTPHYNRFKAYQQVRSATEQMIDGPGTVALEHSLSLLETFTREGSSADLADVKSVGRRRFEYPDGSIWEVAFTDGKYELNERLTQRYNEMAQDSNLIVNRVVRNHFVQTNFRQVSAEAELHAEQLKKHKTAFTIEGMADAKFIGKESWGVTAAQAGYKVRTPFGQTRQAFSSDYSKSVHMQMYFEPVRDENGQLKNNVDPDGVPTDRVLDHDKLTMVEWYDKRKPQEVWVDIYIGSYNNSNNRYNAERQDFIRVRKESDLYRSLYNHVIENAKLAEKEGRSINLKDGIFIKELALFLGHEPNDLDWKKAVALKKDFQETISQLLASGADTAEEMRKFGEQIRSLVPKTPSRLIKSLQVAPDKLNRNLNALLSFFQWYLKLPKFRQGVKAEISADEIISLSSSLLRNSKGAKFALNDILWGPLIPRHIIEARSYRAFTQMKLKELFISNGATPEQADFPFYDSPFFNVSQVSAELLIEWKALFDSGDKKNFKKLSDMIYSWAKAIEEKNSGAKYPPQAADSNTILTRLNQLQENMLWYENLPAAQKKSFVLSKDELVKQFLSESIDILVNKNLDIYKARDLVKYTLILKGFDFRKNSELFETSMAALKQGVAIYGINLDEIGLDYPERTGSIKASDENKAKTSSSTARDDKNKASPLTCSKAFKNAG